MESPSGNSFAPMGHGVRLLVPSTNQSAISQTQPLSQDTLSLDTSADSFHLHYHDGTGSKSYQQSPQQPSVNTTELSFNDNHNLIQQDTAQLLQDSTYDYIPYTNVRHGPRVSPDEPWNHVDAVTTPMKHQPNSSLSVPKHRHKRPHTDSGYASSQNLQQHPSQRQQFSRSLESGANYPYDEPIGSAAQQNHILPDQQHRPSSIAHTIPRTRGPPSTAATEPQLTSSGVQDLHCEVCDENFSTKSEMSKHMARHSKKYICDFPSCPRIEGFATKNDLERHKVGVHNDSSMSKKEYKCSVPDCKDPNKVWKRKDNFKAHVVRMHPDHDPDSVVRESCLTENGSYDNNTSSRTESVRQEHSQQDNYYPTMENLPQQPYTTTNYDETLDLDAFAEEASYYETPTSTLAQQTYQHLQPHSSAYLGLDYSSVANTRMRMTPKASNYPSSITMAANSLSQDQMTPLFSYRVPLTPVHPSHTYSMNHMRPIDSQTAPLLGQATDDIHSFFDFNPHADSTPAIGSAMPALDPIFQTTHAGSWQSTPPNNFPQQAEISEQLNPSSTQATDGSSSLGPAQEERRDAVLKEVMDILHPLTGDQLKQAIEIFRLHPNTPKKAACEVHTALETLKPLENRSFPCRRDNCPKTFSQNNVRKKHERRHDKAFFCTFDGCYQRFGTKDDLRRHESRKHLNHQYHGWRCFSEDVPTSQHKPECFKFFEDGEKFQQHRRDDHRERADKNGGGLKATKNCHVHQGKPGPFWCGFCSKVIPNEPSRIDGTKVEKFRYDHIDVHITKEKKTMDDWYDLKSDGMPKSQVKARDQQAAGNMMNEESDAEEDAPSPIASATIDNSTSQNQSNHRQGFQTPFNPMHGRKRAASDAGPHPFAPPAKKVSSAYLQPPQMAQSPLYGASTATTSGTVPSGSGINRDPRRMALFVQCCNCAYQKPLSDDLNCGNGGCFHPPCHECAYWDRSGTQVYPRPSSGARSSRNK